MLIHRANCVKQFQLEINKDVKQDVITVQTYQSLEHRILNNFDIELTQYKYIVCDEFHYFLSDASFNNKTDISFRKILESSFAVRIFMSATGADIKDYINNFYQINTINYSLPYDYSFIRTLTFFNKDETIRMFVKEAIEKDQKGIFFIQSAEKAYSLYREFKDLCLFNCSRTNQKYYKYVDKNKIDSMLENERFEEKFLITTTCFDAGSNIVDKDLKHIVVDVYDINSLIQCVGRKRINYDDPEDKINLYVKIINNQKLAGLERTTKKKVEMAEYLKKHSTTELIEKYKRQADLNNIIYDEIVNNDNNNICTKKVNELMYIKKKLDIGEYQLMKQYGEFGYCKKLAHLFGFYDSDNDRYTYRTIKEKYNINNYLDKCIHNIFYQQSDRADLIKTIDVKSNGKQLKSIESLNGALQERGINYRIVKFATSQIVDGKQKKYPSAWRVVKLE